MCDACGLRSTHPQPPFESSSVLFITLTYTSSMQELIMTITMTRKVYLLLKLYKNQNQVINNASTWYVTKNIVKCCSILGSVTTLANGAEVMTYDHARNATKLEKSCFRCKEVCWMIWHCYYFLFGFKCTFQLYSSTFSISWYQCGYHVTLCIGQQQPITVYRSVWGVRCSGVEYH